MKLLALLFTLCVALHISSAWPLERVGEAKPEPQKADGEATSDKSITLLIQMSEQETQAEPDPAPEAEPKPKAVEEVKKESTQSATA